MLRSFVTSVRPDTLASLRFLIAAWIVSQSASHAAVEQTVPIQIHRISRNFDTSGKKFAITVWKVSGGRYWVNRPIGSKKFESFNYDELIAFLKSEKNKPSLLLNDISHELLWAPFSFPNNAEKLEAAAEEYKKLDYQRVVLTSNRRLYNGIGKTGPDYVYDTSPADNRNGAPDSYERLPPIHMESRYPAALLSQNYDECITWAGDNFEIATPGPVHASWQFGITKVIEHLKGTDHKDSILILTHAPPDNFLSPSSSFCPCDFLANKLKDCGFQRVVIVANQSQSEREGPYFVYDTAASDDVISSKEKVRVY